MVEDGMADIKAFFIALDLAFATVQNELCALFDALLDPARYELAVPFGDDRPELRGFFVSRADDELLRVAYEQLDQLFRADAMDISADIEVLNNMMAQDGLTESGPMAQTSSGELLSGGSYFAVLPVGLYHVLHDICSA